MTRRQFATDIINQTMKRFLNRDFDDPEQLRAKLIHDCMNAMRFENLECARIVDNGSFGGEAIAKAVRARNEDTETQPRMFGDRMDSPLPRLS